jgi:hypothetical protein
MRLALFAIAIAACAEDPRPAPPRNDQVLAPEPNEEPALPEELPLDEETPLSPPPIRGGEHRPFEVVVQLVPFGESSVANGERLAVVVWDRMEPLTSMSAVIDLRTGLVRAVRGMPMTFGSAALAPGERSAMLFAPGPEYDSDVYIWDLMRNDVIELEGSTERITVADDGHAYVYFTGEADEAEIWSLRMASHRRRRLARAPLGDLYLAPRGDRLLVRRDETVQLLDARNGRSIAELPSRQISFDPRGRYLVAVQEETIEIRDPRRGNVLREVRDIQERGPIVWSPRGELFCIGRKIVDPDDGAVRDAEQRCDQEGDTLTARGVIERVSPPRASIVGSGDTLSYVVRATPRAIEAYAVPTIDWVRSGEGFFELSWAMPGAPTRFIMVGGERREVPQPPFVFPRGDVLFTIDPEARAITVQRGLSAPVPLRDLPADLALACAWESEGSTLEVRCDGFEIGVTLDGHFVSITRGGRTLLFDVATGESSVELDGGGEIRAHDQRIVAIGERRTRLWDIRGREIATLPAAESAVFSPDGRELALLIGRRIGIYASETGERLRELRAPGALSSLAWDEASAIRGQLARGEELVRLSPANGLVLSRTDVPSGARRSSDAQWVSCREGSMYVFNAADREERGPLGRCPEPPAFFSASASFVTWTDGVRARIHRISDGEVLEILPLGEGRAVAWTETGWFESFDVPLDAMRLRTGSISRGTMHVAAGSPNHRPGLTGAFMAGTDLGDAPPYPMPGED